MEMDLENYFVFADEQCSPIQIAVVLAKQICRKGLNNFKERGILCV